jgi:hypothetical protein
MSLSVRGMHACRELRQDKLSNTDRDKTRSKDARVDVQKTQQMQDTRQPLASTVSNLEPLTVTIGLVPLQPINVDIFEETLQKLGDPIPRPRGSHASATLVAVFSHFLRHSAELTGSQRPHIMAGQPSRKSESGVSALKALSSSSGGPLDVVPAAADAEPGSLLATGKVLSCLWPPHCWQRPFIIFVHGYTACLAIV